MPSTAVQPLSLAEFLRLPVLDKLSLRLTTDQVFNWLKMQP